LNNKTYTEEELKTILEDLSLHKQQVKDLEQQMQHLVANQEQTASDKPLEFENNSIKLKKLLQALKKRYQTVYRELSSLKHQQEEGKSSGDQDPNSHQALFQAQQYIASLEEELAALQIQQNDLQKILTQNQEEKNKIQQEMLLALQQLEHYEESFSLLEEENQKLKQNASSHLNAALPPSEAYKNLLQQCVDQQSQIEKLSASMQEKDAQLRSVQQYGHHIKQLISKKENLEEHLSKEIQLALIAQEEKKFTDDRLAESQKHAEQLGRVIQFLRERLEEAHLEANQLQEDFKNSQDSLEKLTGQLASEKEENAQLQGTLLDLQQEKADALDEAHSLSLQFAKLKDHIALLEIQELDLDKTQQELKKSQDLALALQDELTKTQRTMEELRRNIEIIRKNESALEIGLKSVSADEKALQAAFKELQQENNSLKTTYEQHVKELEMALLDKEGLFDTQSMQLEELQKTVFSLTNEKERAEELEANLKTAHVHLAKKVKEIALYQEKYEEQKLHIHEMEEIHLQYESQITELHKNLETHHDSERHLLEQIKKWEKQHLEASEKLQKAEARAAELKEMELKHNQMQAFLKNMGSLIAPSQSSPSPAMTSQAEHTSTPAEEETSLFDWSSQTPKHKQTFFD